MTCSVIYECLEANDVFDMFFYIRSGAEENHAHPKKVNSKEKNPKLLKEDWLRE